MNRFIKFIFFLLPSAFSLQPLLSQPLNSIYETNTLVSFEKYIYGTDSSFHTSIRPYLVSDFKKIFNYETIVTSYYIRKNKDTIQSAFSHQLSAFRLPPSAFNLIFNRNLFAVNKKDYGFTIDPLFDFGYGYDFANDRSTWINTRGFLIEGHLGNNFAFSSRFYETQSRVPLWIDNYARNRYIMPGQGRAKGYGSDALDFANASGYVSWSPGKFFNFQFGHGKHFFGDGYRSLILSDHSLYHPYLMITTSFWKIKYVNLYSQFSHPDLIAHQGTGDVIFEKKYGTFHYLSYAPGKRWNISIFESIIWQASDSSYNRGFDINYLNPVIFFRPVEFNLGSADNAMMGLNLRFTAFNWLTFYSQFVIDEMRIKELTAGNGWAGNKYAWQAGLKTFDLFGIANFNVQTEVNFIRPYLYAHYEQVQNYSNAKEPLAHPSGANIKEAAAIVKYNWKRLYLNLKYVWSGFGLDYGNQNYGKDIFRNPQTAPEEYGNFTTQGLYTTLNQLDASVSYLVNPSTNMNLFLSYIYRAEKNTSIDNRYSYVSFGFRTSLRNLYYDFF
jgi:hypothetical protein